MKISLEQILEASQRMTIADSAFSAVRKPSTSSRTFANLFANRAARKACTERKSC